jgi:hypothetical protein
LKGWFYLSEASQLPPCKLSSYLKHLDLLLSQVDLHNLYFSNR